MVHALDGRAPDQEDAHLVGQVEGHGDRRHAPRSQQVEACLLGQSDFLTHYGRFARMRQSGGIQTLPERSLETNPITVEVEVSVLDREFSHAEPDGQ